MTRGGADTSTPPEPGASLSGTRPQPWTLSPTPQPAHHPWALVTKFFARASRAWRTRHPWTLERRLLVIVAALLVGVSIVVGVISILVVHNAAVEQVERDLSLTVSRAEIGFKRIIPGDPLAQPGIVLAIPGQKAGTIAAFVSRTGEVHASYIAENGLVADVADASALLLRSAPSDEASHVIGIPGYGDFLARAIAVQDWSGLRIVIALPLSEVYATTTRLSLTIAIVALLGLGVALCVGSLIVRGALSPLTAMTTTARRVSELPLDRGDVALPHRVVEEDERTEVGKLGAAFNRMLGHMASSLHARELSERRVRQFVADASHELRTPLASIRGYAELTRLHGRKLSSDMSRAITRIESESVRMTGLVDDLLLLARLDEGRELSARPVELRQLLVDAVGDAQVAGPGYHWSVEVPDGEVWVMGDESRLRQVLVNLLANARTHTPEGTTVTAGAMVVDGRVRIIVADDGPGIPPELSDTIFERFARGDASRSRTAGSTGLGLSIVRAVVLAHQGRVWVDSQPGRTEFIVELPVAALTGLPSADAESHVR